MNAPLPFLPVPVPISKLQALSSIPSGLLTTSSIMPIAIWDPNKLGPGVGGFRTVGIRVSELSSILGSGGGGGGPVAASLVTFVPGGNVSSTNVQAAILELDNEKVASSALATVATSGRAADVAFTPGGGIASNNLQTALNEIDTEKTNNADLALVAKSGSANDLGGTQITVPTVVGGSAPGSSLTLTPSSNASPSGDFLAIVLHGVEYLRYVFDAAVGNIARTLIGATTPQSFTNQTSAQLQLHSILSGGANFAMSLSNWANTNTGPNIIGTKSWSDQGGSGPHVGGHGAVPDVANAFAFQGHLSDGQAWGVCATINLRADGPSQPANPGGTPPTLGSTPGKITFATQNKYAGTSNGITPGAPVPNPCMTIWRDGGVSIGPSAANVSGPTGSASPGPGILQVDNGIICKTTFAADAPAAAQIKSVVTPGFLYVTVPGVNFNSVADTPVTLPTLPTSITRLRLQDLTVSNPSATIIGASVGLFTNTGGGGTTMVASASLSTLTSSADNTAGNVLRITGVGTLCIKPSTLPTPNTVYVRNTVAQGTAVTADVTLVFEVLP